MEKIRQSDPTQLSGNNWQFDDPRLNTMLYRYRARNYPSTLSAEEVNRWQQHRQQRLVDSGSEYGVNLTNYYNELTDLAALYQHDPVKLRVLRDLHQYAENL